LHSTGTKHNKTALLGATKFNKSTDQQTQKICAGTGICGQNFSSVSALSFVFILGGRAKLFILARFHCAKNFSLWNKFFPCLCLFWQRTLRHPRGKSLSP